MPIEFWEFDNPLSFPLLSVSFIFLSSSPRGIFFSLPLEKKRQGEKKGKMETSTWDRNINGLPVVCTQTRDWKYPDQGLHPHYVPWLTTKDRTFQLQDDTPVNYNTQARALYAFQYKLIVFLLVENPQVSCVSPMCTTWIHLVRQRFFHRSFLDNLIAIPSFCWDVQGDLYVIYLITLQSLCVTKCSDLLILLRH